MELRPYQRDTLNSLWRYFETHKGNPIVALPTGTGKSIIIAEWVKYAIQTYPHTRVMMLTHVKELIEQNFNKLLMCWPCAPAGIYSAGLKKKESFYPITFAGIQSVDGKAELFGRIDIVLIDECHLVSNKNNTRYQNFISDLKKRNPYLKVIGLTATPYRLGLGLLTEGDIFSDIAIDYTDRDKFTNLIDAGFLAPLVPKKTTAELDTTGVKVHGGEYNLSELQEKVNTVAINQAALSEAVALAGDRKHWLVFTTGIMHCEAIALQLCEMGINADYVHSKMPNKQRDEAIRSFKEGKIQALVNADILTTGFDFPAMDCIVMLRPTQSCGLWVQMLGRGTRPFPGKENCLVLDFAGNTARLGPINDPVIPRKKGSRGGGDAPVKVCAACLTFVHSAVRNCPYCGFEFPLPETNIHTKASELELIARPEALIQEFSVSKVICRIHEKRDRPDSLRLDFHCGLRRFSTFLCFEHGGYPTRKARDWWINHVDENYPETTEEAFRRRHELPTFSSIRVWLQQQNYSEIVAYFTEAS